MSFPCFTPFDDLPYAIRLPACAGRIRSCPEDFVVEEQLPFAPDGSGEHVWLYIRKRNLNTVDVQKRLARFAGLKLRDVSYAGLKDRVALTTQWFGLHMPGLPDPDWQQFNTQDITVLESSRHSRKLRRGITLKNRFTLRVRELAGDRAALEETLQFVAAGAVPNYFGPQRFGHSGGNIARAWQMFADGYRVRDRHRRGLYLSAARSALFNEVLAYRVADASWNRGLPGEVMMLDGSQSIFTAQAIDQTLTARLQAYDLHPTAPLWGRGELGSEGAARLLEEQVLAKCGAWRQGLEEAGLKQERRAMRLRPEMLEWEFSGDDLWLSFELSRGAYATSVLRELLSDSGGEPRL